MTIVLRTESTGIRPDFDYIEELGRKAVRSSFTPAALRVRSVAPNSKVPTPTNLDLDVRRWTLVWNRAPLGEKYKLQTAWRASFGGTLEMEYTPVGELDTAKVNVTFIEGSMEIVRTGLLTYDMSAKVEESR